LCLGITDKGKGLENSEQSGDRTQGVLRGGGRRWGEKNGDNIIKFAHVFALGAGGRGKEWGAVDCSEKGGSKED